ncbi:unnamed protein product [Amoebophrya sp. A25]|nr:unnamed protein product [Amoebophrya sp. A25]|eukprot:GSA25T00026581001.1
MTRFNAARFAQCRNAQYCPWSQMMNQQFRGVYAGAAAVGAFGRAAVTVMGEAPAQTGFAEQVAGQSSGIAEAINFLNASKGAASDLSDEVMSMILMDNTLSSGSSSSPRGSVLIYMLTDIFETVICSNMSLTIIAGERTLHNSVACCIKYCTSTCIKKNKEEKKY